MGTVRRIDDNRGVAVRRYQHGESVRSIAMSLGRSRWWVYKWLARAATGGPAWATDRSRRLDVFGERFLVPPPKRSMLTSSGPSMWHANASRSRSLAT